MSSHTGDNSFSLGQLLFEWDHVKARINRTKHGVSSEEGASVFADPDALLLADPDHSDAEQRFLLLGYSARERILVVVHVERGPRIRLISARPATLGERKSYEGQ